MKIVIIGGTGTIGKAVADQLKVNHEVITELPERESPTPLGVG